LSVPSDEGRAPRDSTFTAVFSVLVTLVGCAVVVLTMPRPVEPALLPPLVLDRAAATAALKADAEVAARAPRGADVDQLYEAFLEEGRNERRGSAAVAGMHERHTDFALLSRRVLTRVGEDGVTALRARATERFVAALLGELPAGPEVEGLFGTFPDLLRRYGLVAADGTIRAPELSVRAMYKARWNLIHGRPLYERLSAVELQAYEGWNALHASSLPQQRRLHSARMFHEAGGRHAREAYAFWLYHTRSLPQAQKLLQEARKKSGALRLRNALMAVWRARR
jgi:hypothetical protein